MGTAPKKPAGKFAIPMVRANFPAVLLASDGLCGKRALQVSAVPTQALPMVSGICGRISMMKAVQKSAAAGAIG
jgi:hypothetical protein